MKAMTVERDATRPCHACLARAAEVKGKTPIDEVTAMEEFIQARIARYSPDEHKKWIEEFKVPLSTGMTFQTLLRYIYENMDPTLSFRDYRCGRGSCNTCRIKVDGKAIKPCATPVGSAKEVLLEPAGTKVIKDLVISYD
jgi:succinate dehydrogenase / fumarate reductase iron-sulfur subunit